jgi:hypothetical protein
MDPMEQVIRSEIGIKDRYPSTSTLPFLRFKMQGDRATREDDWHSK